MIKEAVRLAYPLVDGFIHDWLVAGPLAMPVENLAAFPGADFKLQIARHRYRPEPGVEGSPLERQSFTRRARTQSWPGASGGVTTITLSISPPFITPATIFNPGFLRGGKRGRTDVCSHPHHQWPGGHLDQRQTRPPRGKVPSSDPRPIPVCAVTRGGIERHPRAL